MLSWREEWIRLLLGELTIILMFLHVGITFGPIDESLYKRPYDGTFRNLQLQTLSHQE